MSALMDVQVDQLRGSAHAADGGLGNRFAVADEGDDAAVMVGVHFAVEQIHARDLHGIDDGVDLCGIATFREVGNTLNKSGRHD